MKKETDFVKKWFKWEICDSTIYLNQYSDLFIWPLCAYISFAFTVCTGKKLFVRYELDISFILQLSNLTLNSRGWQSIITLLLLLIGISWSSCNFDDGFKNIVEYLRRQNKEYLINTFLVWRNSLVFKVSSTPSILHCTF